MDLGLGDTSAATNAARLERINRDLYGQQHGSGLDPQDVNDEFVRRLSLLIDSEMPTELIAAYGQQAERDRSRFKSLQQLLFEPLLLVLLGYVGLLAFCAFTVPHFESQLGQYQIEPGPVTQFMISLREWLPIWAIGFPLAILVISIAWKRTVSVAITRLLGGRISAGDVTSLELRALIDSGKSAEEALAIRERGSADHSDPGARPADNESVEVPLEDRIIAACSTANVRETIAQERHESVWRSIRFWCGLALAGCITLFYACVMFLPLIELFHGLADSQTGMTP